MPTSWAGRNTRYTEPSETLMTPPEPVVTARPDDEARAVSTNDAAPNAVGRIKAAVAAAIRRLDRLLVRVFRPRRLQMFRPDKDRPLWVGGCPPGSLPPPGRPPEWAKPAP